MHHVRRGDRGGLFHTEPHASAAATAMPRSRARRTCRGRDRDRRTGALLPRDAGVARATSTRGAGFVSSSHAASHRDAGGRRARARHLPRNKVTVQSPRMGGGFGGKETQRTAAAFAALGAQAHRAARCGCSSIATRHDAHRQTPPVPRASRRASTTTGAPRARGDARLRRRLGLDLSEPVMVARSSTSTTPTRSRPRALTGGSRRRT